MGSSALFACGIGFATTLPYPVIICLFVFYALFVQGDSAALHTGVVLSADKERQGATMAVQSLLGFACAFAGPIVTGVVLDATGSGQTVGSWVASFITMGMVAALGPVFLAFFASRNHQTRL
jgi:MFS family permease